MLTFWNAHAVALYLVPLAITFVARARPGRESWRAALDAIAVIGADLLSVVLLARLLPLDVAALVSRCVWLIAGPCLIYVRRSEVGAWWRSVDLRSWINPIACALAAAAVSYGITGMCGLWDRYWHIPLVASLRGQHTPFANVYDSGGALYYHYFGDVLAAMFQTMSLAHVHASSALSRMHDVLFALFGLMFAGLLPRFGLSGLVTALIGTLGSLLAGPATLLIAGSMRPAAGRSIVNLFSLSFRPHTPLAYLLMLGFVACVLMPVIDPHAIRARALRVHLFLCTAALVMTDESSLGLLGVFLAGVWLCAPGSLAETRLRGVLVGLGMLAVIGAVVLLYGGSFTPGVPRPAVAVASAFRVPGFDQYSLGLATPEGKRAFLEDFWGPLAICAAGLLAVFTVRTRAVRAAFTGYFVMTLVGLLALLKLDINGGGTECHRFATASLLFAPMLGLYFAAQPGMFLSFASSRSLVALLVGLGIGVPALSSAEWAIGLGANICKGAGLDNYAQTDCQSYAAARIGERTAFAYVDQHAWYTFAGCRPLRAPSSQVGTAGHQIFTGAPALGLEGLHKLDTWLNAAPLTAFCAVPTSDPVCVWLVTGKRGACRAENPSFLRCTMSAALRRELLPPPPAPSP